MKVRLAARVTQVVKRDAEGWRGPPRCNPHDFESIELALRDLRGRRRTERVAVGRGNERPGIGREQISASPLPFVDSEFHRIGTDEV